MASESVGLLSLPTPGFHHKQEAFRTGSLPKITYGTFYPQLAGRNSELPEQLDREEEDEIQELNPKRIFPSPIHHHSRNSSGESGFVEGTLSPVYIDSERCPRDSVHLELEFESVFEHMESRISEVEHKLDKLISSDAEDEDIDMNSTVLTINAEPGDYSNIDISTNYTGTHKQSKQYRSAFGILCQLKQSIMQMKPLLESSCEKFDSLIEEDYVLDHSTRELMKKRERELKDRLDSCLVETKNQMDTIRRNNEIIINGTGGKSCKHFISQKKPSVGCVNWFHILLFIALMGVILYMYLWSNSSDQWVVYIRLVRSPILLVFLLYLYGFNIQVWQSFNIDYVTIFNHSPTSPPTARSIFKIARILTVIFTLLVVVLIVTSRFSVILPIKIIPLVMWLVILAFLVNPFNYFQRRNRFNFIVVFFHVLLAPLVFVYFADFFLADQFNSTVAIFLDIQYLICYFFKDSWSGQVNPQICTSSSNGIRPVISFLPTFWRMLQCFRCYYDTHNIKHLVNAGKYFTTLPVIVFTSMFAVKVKGNIWENFQMREVGWIMICWGLAALIHALYTFIWDVSCDWGLWDVMKCSLFKRKLLYSKKYLYYLAIVTDMVLRFVWTLKLTLAIIWQVDSDLIYTGESEMFVCFSKMRIPSQQDTSIPSPLSEDTSIWEDTSIPSPLSEDTSICEDTSIPSPLSEDTSICEDTSIPSPLSEDTSIPSPDTSKIEPNSLYSNSLK